MASSTEIHGVRWQEVCPWLLLVRAVRISLYIRVLALALVGVLLTQVGWHAATLAMKAPDRWTWSAADAPLVVWGALDPARRSSSAPDRIREETDRAFSAHAIFFATDHPFLRGWAWSMQPACRVREATTGRDRACLVAAQAWTLAV